LAKATFNLSDLGIEYRNNYAACIVEPSSVKVISDAAAKISAGKDRYTSLEKTTGVPWYVIGAIHYREGDCDFETHLYNGDPLTGRTTHEPKGQPLDIEPPYTFEIAAECALRDEKFTSWKNWSLEGTLFRWEGYNGWGYRGHGVLTPYLWSFSNLYKRGGFPKDHVWDPNYVSRQAGCAVILKWMEAHSIISIPASVD
jgi:lysozyme family protein